MTLDNLKQWKKIHMIGIGGVSMSGLAEILLEDGFPVSEKKGSGKRTDSKYSPRHNIGRPRAVLHTTFTFLLLCHH